MVEALADLAEALDRGRAELDKASHRIIDQAQIELVDALNDLHASLSWFRRRRTRAYHQAVVELVRRHGPVARRPLFDALIEGYSLIQARLERAEELIEPLLARTLTCLDQSLSDAKLLASHLDKVVLVGGATRTPLVHRLLPGATGLAGSCRD